MMPPDAYPETPKRWSPLKRWLLIGVAVIAGGLITAELVIRPLVETESGPPPPGQDKQRLALILFSVEGMPQREVAEVLECSVELVKWNVFQARQKLKEMLAVYL